MTDAERAELLSLREELAKVRQSVIAATTHGVALLSERDELREENARLRAAMNEALCYLRGDLVYRADCTLAAALEPK